MLIRMREKVEKYLVIIMNKDQSTVIANRWQVIRSICENKKVLDIGCVDHTVNTEGNYYWLHKQIKSVASSVIGVDILEEEIKKLNQKEYNIIYGDALKIDLKEQFDVVIAGEFIEHISDRGIFLSNMYKHLKDDGTLVITTPNMFAFRYQLRNLIFGNVIPNQEHVCWYDYFTLRELCERNNFKVVKSFYHFEQDTPWYKYWPVRFLTFLRKNYAPRILFVLEKN